MEPPKKLTGTNAERLTVLQTPFCGDLRSKKFYMQDAIATTAEDFYDLSGHTWCYNTQMPIGPDGLAVVPEQCGPGRGCYRSALAQVPEYVPLKANDNIEV